MKRMLIGLLALALPALSGVAPSRADAAAAVHDFRGHYAAFTGALGGPDTRPGTIDITTQLGTLVLGRANLAGRVFSLTGTVSATGAVNLVGIGGPDTLTIRAHLVDDLGQVGRYEPCIFEGTYVLSSLLGGRRTGQLVAVHQVSTTDAPSIRGEWAGSIADPNNPGTILGRARATFDQAGDGKVAGGVDAVLFDPQPDPPAFQFVMAGQAHVDQNQFASYLLIGSADGALATLQVRGVQADPGGPVTALSGLLRIRRTDGTVQDTFVQLQPVTGQAAS